MFKSSKKLIVDSGSTKSDWVFLKEGEEQQTFQTMGFNPVFQDVETISNVLKEHRELCLIATEVDELFFYGAGCSNDVYCNIVRKSLSSIFINAVITVKHDLYACAYATYEGIPSISCILGTGSNACFFDGIKLTQTTPSLGYILGDEGSGAYFGKQLLALYLYKRLPSDLLYEFEQWNPITKEQAIEAVYKQPKPNTYLASFMKFAQKNAQHPFIKKMIFEGFKNFNKIHVCSFDSYQSIRVHYVGSIALLFKEELMRAALIHNISVGNIIQKPIDGLVKYHQFLK